MTLRQSLEIFRNRHPAERVVIRGRRWEFVDSGGSGPALLMLPGTVGSAHIFWNQMAALGETLRIISVSYPLTTSVEGHVGDLARLLDRLGLERCSVLGTSFGGFVAQAFAQAHPQRTETLLIANSLADVALIGEALPPVPMLAVLPAAMLRARMVRQIGDWPAPDEIGGEVKLLLIDELVEHLASRAPKTRLLALLRAGAIPKPAIADEHIVIIDAEDDPLIPRAAREDVRRRYPRAHHHGFETGGHFPYLARADDYTAILRRRLLPPDGVDRLTAD